MNPCEKCRLEHRALRHSMKGCLSPLLSGRASRRADRQLSQSCSRQANRALQVLAAEPTEVPSAGEKQDNRTSNCDSDQAEACFAEATNPSRFLGPAGIASYGRAGSGLGAQMEASVPVRWLLRGDRARFLPRRQFRRRRIPNHNGGLKVRGVRSMRVTTNLTSLFLLAIVTALLNLSSAMAEDA